MINHMAKMGPKQWAAVSVLTSMGPGTVVTHSGRYGDHPETLTLWGQPLGSGWVTMGPVTVVEMVAGLQTRLDTRETILDGIVVWRNQ